MPSKLSELVGMAGLAIRRITNEGLLFAIVLFVVATLAAVALLRQPSIPWWAQATVAALLLAAVLFIAYCLAHPFLSTPKPLVFSSSISLGKLRDELQSSLTGKSDSEYDELLESIGIPPFPADRDTENKKINYIIENYPALRLLPRQRDLTKILVVAASCLLLLPL